MHILYFYIQLCYLSDFCGFIQVDDASYAIAIFHILISFISHHIKKTSLSLSFVVLKIAVFSIVYIWLRARKIPFYTFFFRKVNNELLDFKIALNEKSFSLPDAVIHIVWYNIWLMKHLFANNVDFNVQIS